MTYGTKAVVPAKIGELSFQIAHFDSLFNGQALALNLDLLEIKRDKAQLLMATYQ